MKRTAIFMAILSCIMSCSDADKVAFRGGHSITLDADIIETGEVAGTKASGQSVIKLQWNAGDQVSVINVTRGLIYKDKLSADATGYNSRFSGTVSSVNQGDVLAFVYPPLDGITSDVAFTDQYIDFTTQTGNKVCVIGSTTATSSTFTNASVSFSFQMGFLRINMSDLPSNTPITSVTISNMDTRLKLYIEGGALKSTGAAELGTISVTGQGKITDLGTKTVTIGIVPVASASGRVITVNTATASYETSFFNVAFSRNSNTNANVCGFVPSNMSFADETVSSKCIEMFDRNGDGMLSFVEAAGVTDLGVSTKAAGGNPFPNTIQKFAELQFFLGLAGIPSFAGYAQLNTVAIPSQIASLSDNTFNGCTMLENVIFKSATPPSLGTNVFAGCDSALKIYVPTSSVASYKAAWPSLSAKVHDIAEVGANFGLNDWSNGKTISGNI